MEMILNEQGKKYTLSEYFRKVNNEGLFEIRSNIFGHCITGTYSQIVGGLQKHFFSSCIQGIETDEYGTTIYLI